MADQQRKTQSSTLHSATRVGQLGLTVADLRRSIDFYTNLIGLTVLEQDETTATLGAPEEPILVLEERPWAQPWPRGGRSYTGLYHFAILVPSRTDLGRWLDHWLRQDMPLPGQGDHIVSEALYLEDPDGHGIEVYRDRPREEWEWQNGTVRMAADPVDIRGLLEEAQRSADPFTNMPVGTTLGHIHLQVSDIEETARFYSEIIGFDIVARMPSALFMSAGGYHHHVGANVWHSKSATPAPEESVGLRYYTIDFPDNAARDAAIKRLEDAGIRVNVESNMIHVGDPSEITVRLRSEEGGE